MENLTQFTQKISRHFAGRHSFVVPSGQLSLTEDGLLCTQKNKFKIQADGLQQFGNAADIPANFFMKLQPDHQATLFNRLFPQNIYDKKIPPKIRINLSKNDIVLGYDSPDLLKLSPLKVIDAIYASLPQGLSAEQIMIGHSEVSSSRLHLSCYSPEKSVEPQVGDIINGGIDVLHDISGDRATQINCYMRRLVCTNGAIAHVCNNQTKLQTRRLHDGRFDEGAMIDQIVNVLSNAWQQIDSRLESIKNLLNQKAANIDFLKQQRTQFALSNAMFKRIERAVYEDELGRTNTLYDYYNSISRVATRSRGFTFRQMRTLSRIAGEMSQSSVHKCGQCGTWVVNQN